MRIPGWNWPAGRLAAGGGGVERVSAQSHDGTASDDAQDNSFAVAFRRHLSPRGAREIVSFRPQHPTFPSWPVRVTARRVADRREIAIGYGLSP